jgi:hypothetical protein
MKLTVPVQRGIGVAIISLLAYLSVVVVTTPSLSPLAAVSTSVLLNWWVIAAVGSGTGAQAFLLSYARSKACGVKYGRTAVGASGIFSGFSSFFSFLALIPVGCCGTWLYLLSFLPGLIGVGASGFLVGNSVTLQVASLILMALSVTYTYVSVRRRLIDSGSSRSRTSPGAQYGRIWG